MRLSNPVVHLLGLVHVGGKRLRFATVLDPSIEDHLLDDFAELVRTLGIAGRGTDGGLGGRGDLGGLGGVLDVEDGLVSVDKFGKGLALAVLDALLVDGEVDVVDDLVDDAAGVLEAG